MGAHFGGFLAKVSGVETLRAEVSELTVGGRVLCRKNKDEVRNRRRGRSRRKLWLIEESLWLLRT